MVAIWSQLIVLVNLSVMTSAISYAFTLFLAREFHPSEFGLYSYALICGSFLSLLTGFGTTLSAPAQYGRLNDLEEVSAHINFLRLFMFIPSMIIGLILAKGSVSTFLGVTAVCASALNFSYFYEIEGLNRRYALTYFIERISYIAVTLCLCLWLELSLPLLFSSLLVVTVSSLVWQYFDCSSPKLTSAIGDTLENARSNLPIVVALLSVYAYGGFSRLVLEEKLGVKELGIFSAAWQVVMLVTLFQSQVERIWRMKFSSKPHTSRTMSVEIGDYLLGTTIPVLALSITIYWFGETIISILFSDAYLPAGEVVSTLALYFPIVSLDGLIRMLTVQYYSIWIYALVHCFFGTALLLFLITSSVNSMLEFAISIIVFHSLALLTMLVLIPVVYQLRVNRDSS
jgi:O-antigen/teichoic acid export membrane protein